MGGRILTTHFRSAKSGFIKSIHLRIKNANGSSCRRQTHLKIAYGEHWSAQLTDASLQVRCRSMRCSSAVSLKSGEIILFISKRILTKWSVPYRIVIPSIIDIFRWTAAFTRTSKDPRAKETYKQIFPIFVECRY